MVLRVLFVFIFLIPIFSFQDDVYKGKREKLVKQTIENRGVENPAVLDAMRSVKRHLFVPDNSVTHAYEDRPLPIGYGQTISQPFIVAFMTAQGITGLP